MKSTHLYKALLGVAVMTAPFILPGFAKEPDKKAPAATAPAVNNNEVDWATISRIRGEAFHNSKIMEIMSGITDGIGPRLTNSPNMRKANAWTRDQLTKFGLENAHLEKWGPFGNGWAYQKSSVRMTAPDSQEFIALPKAWTPGTNGLLKGKLQRVKLDTQADLDANKGKLAGAILLVGEMRDVAPGDKPKMSRYSEEQLQELGQYPQVQNRAAAPNPFAAMTPEERRRRAEFARALTKFLQDEKVGATIEPTRLPGVDGTIFVQSGGSYREGEAIGCPALVMDIEHYGRLSRLLDQKQDVEMEVEVQAQFYKDDPYGYDTIAEIPGTDLKDQVVMLGAHLDSWHGGTGATDNGAGSGVAMEAVRIIKALDLHPRRTIRIGLWSGEEQGLLGSRGYVAEHLAARPESPNGMPNPNQQFGGGGANRPQSPFNFKPEWDKVSVYFNLDNGSGKVRGIYLQENAQAMPIFQKWMEPFKDLGMTTMTMRNTGGTDHLSFDAVGVPGFQFIQEPLEYDTLTHHSNMDVYERLQRDDLMQASAIMASFVYEAAMRDEMFPRKPLSKADMPPANATPATADAGKGKVTPDKKDAKKKK